LSHCHRWWNPAVEQQATDRAFRIGQQRNVFVYRFITKGTFEEKIAEMLARKRNLANLTVANGEQWIGDLNDQQLEEIFSLSSISTTATPFVFPTSSTTFTRTSGVVDEIE
jgi:SNF2 family DNA or RNA helicase